MPKITSIPREEEIELIRMAQQGDLSARDELIERNMGIVHLIAMRRCTRHMPKDDLAQEGVFGIIDAIERFDPGKHAKFVTYAKWWIVHRMQVATANKSALVRLPVYLLELLSKWKREEEKLARELGRTPSFDEIADRLSLRYKQRQNISRAMGCKGFTAAKVYESFEPGSGRQMEDSPEEIERYVGELLRNIDDSEIEFLRHRFGFNGKPETLAEIGKRRGYTRERARQVQEIILAKLRDAM